MRYALLICASCAALFLVAGRVEPLIPNWYREETPADRARTAVRLEANSAHRLHREYMLADSLVPRLPTTPSFLVEVTPRASDNAASIRAVAAADLSGVDSLKARVGLFIVDAGYGLYTSSNNGVAYDTYHVFTGNDSAGPYCAVAVSLIGSPGAGGVPSMIPELRRMRDDTRYRPRVYPLGPCRFWAGYGAPGPFIDTWLRNGGYYFASAPASALEHADTTRRRDIFGQANYLMRDQNTEACLTHSDEACVRTFMAPAFTARAGSFAAVAKNLMYSSSVFGRGDAALVAKLEQQFGKEKFARFWTSSLPVDQAFEAAFGMSLGTWLHDITSRYYNRHEAGPRMTATTWLLTVAVIMMLCAMSWTLAQRRQIA